MSKIARFAARMLLVALVLGSCMIDLLTDTYSVFYDENGAASGTVPVDSTNYEPDQTVTVLGNSGGLVLEHYAFAGWNTSDDGSGTLYTAGQTFAMGEADVTLYADWDLNDYLVVFNANGGTGTMAPQSIPYHTAANLTPNAFTLAHNSFAGWGTSPGGPVAYADGASYTMDTVGTTLYAQWILNSYALVYDANGGTGTMAPQSFVYGSTAALTLNAFSLAGSLFVGWSAAPDGEVVCGDGAEYTMATEGATLYAAWVSVAELVASTLQESAFFGCSVAVDGDYAIVGASNGTSTNANSGAAYVYHRTGANEWDAGFKLPTDAASNNNYGYSVAISGDYAIVGARYQTEGAYGSAGAAYIYHRMDTNTWDAGARIVASDPAENDYFGTSVGIYDGISDDYAIVGSAGKNANRGAVYVFHRTTGGGDNSWDGGVQLTATGGNADDYFGWSVGISGDYAIVGAYYKEDTGGNPAVGAAYVFRQTAGTGGNTWDSEVRLTTDSFQVKSNNFFGTSVAIDGDYAVVGAPGATEGRAYVYHRTGTNAWDAGTQILAAGLSVGDQFGAAVAIDGDLVLVGATHYPEGNARGTAFFFERTGVNAWEEGLQLMAADPVDNDLYGCSVALSGVCAVVGAGFDGDDDAGRAYVYRGF